MAKTAKPQKPPEATTQTINKIPLYIPEFKGRLKFISSWYDSKPEKREERTKQLLKNLAESILEKHYNDFNKTKYDLFLRIVDDWYNKDISHQINFIKKMLTEIKGQSTAGIKQLSEKIKWQKEPELLRAHLEKLRDKFIKYENIDKVLSGDEIAVFIKNKTHKATYNNILALYDLWNEKNYISDYIIEKDRNGEKFLERQYKEFMENVFYWDDKGSIKQINHNSMKSIYNERIKKITDAKEHLESILI